MGKEQDPNKRLRQRETAARDGTDSGLVTMTVAAYSDFHGRQWQRMMMALIENSTRELVADDNGEGT